MPRLLRCLQRPQPRILMLGGEGAGAASQPPGLGGELPHLPLQPELMWEVQAERFKAASLWVYRMCFTMTEDNVIRKLGHCALNSSIDVEKTSFQIKKMLRLSIPVEKANYVVSFPSIWENSIITRSPLLRGIHPDLSRSFAHSGLKRRNTATWTVVRVTRKEEEGGPLEEDNPFKKPQRSVVEDHCITRWKEYGSICH
nr:uncharacterized protein LOC123839428 isoform X2 [Mirounga angustirostris]